MSQIDDLQEHLHGNRVKAAKLIDRMADGNLTPDERAEVKAITRDTTETIERIEKLRGDDQALDAIKGMFPAPARAAATNPGRKAAADIVANYKTLTTGAVTTPVNLGFTGGLARDSRYISELMPAINTEAPSFAYLRQTVRTNTAAPVQIGAQKPTSTYSITQVQGYAPTIAHLSEPVPEQYLADETTLAWFLDAEMAHGAMLALDRELLYGDGATLGTSSFEKNIEGLFEVSGIDRQPSDGDVFSTTRKAITRLDLAGEQPSAWVMHPSDWEVIETETTNNGEFILGSQGRSPVNIAERRLWGVQVALSPSLDVGQAILGDFRSAAELRVRQDIEFRWSDSNEDDFEKNLKRFRSEIRAGLAIHRTPAFVIVSLSDNASS